MTVFASAKTVTSTVVALVSAAGMAIGLPSTVRLPGSEVSVGKAATALRVANKTDMGHLSVVRDGNTLRVAIRFPIAYGGLGLSFPNGDIIKLIKVTPKGETYTVLQPEEDIEYFRETPSAGPCNLGGGLPNVLSCSAETADGGNATVPANVVIRGDVVFSHLRPNGTAQAQLYGDMGQFVMATNYAKFH